MGSAKRITRKLDELNKVDILVGTFAASNSDGTVQVDFGQGPITCLWSGISEPLAGVPVRCIRAGTATVVLGPSVTSYSYGTVTATGSPAITVDVAGVSLQMPYLLSFTPRTIGDNVLVDWSTGYPVVVGELSAVPASSYVPDPTPPAPSSFSADFRANDSGSFSGSWNQSDVWCSNTYIGAWFYGSQIADTIPDSATITNVGLYLPAFYTFGDPPTIGMHGDQSKGGAPSVTDAVNVAPGSGWRDLPFTFGEALKTGAKWGVGTDHGGFHKYRSVGSDGDSGMLHIEWSV